jgi:uncharacterized protein DUF1835
MLHVRCGDDILDALGEAGLPGERLSWADPLAEGPVDAGVEGDAWYEQRADWLSRRHGVPVEEALARLRAQDDALERGLGQDEVVLWFEHDLFDQAILARLLAWFDDHAGVPGRLTMVDVEPCLREVPGFRGLGQLGPEPLARLYEARRPVTPAQLALGARAWAAMRDPDPDALEELLAGHTEALPYLRDAVVRLCLERRPGRDGLVMSERLALEVVRDGARTGADAFRAVQDREAAPWMADTSFWAVLGDLAARRPPLLEAGEEPWARRTLTLTGAGEQALAGG